MEAFGLLYNLTSDLVTVCTNDEKIKEETVSHTSSVGMPFTTGVISRRGIVATVDAPPVALLKRAGAIPLGVTNTSELCMWSESHNHLNGITNNPYDLERIPGGSSGQ